MARGGEARDRANEESERVVREERPLLAQPVANVLMRRRMQTRLQAGVVQGGLAAPHAARIIPQESARTTPPTEAG